MPMKACMPFVRNRCEALTAKKAEPSQGPLFWTPRTNQIVSLRFGRNAAGFDFLILALNTNSADSAQYDTLPARQLIYKDTLQCEMCETTLLDTSSTPLQVRCSVNQHPVTQSRALCKEWAGDEEGCVPPNLNPNEGAGDGQDS